MCLFIHVWILITGTGTSRSEDAVNDQPATLPIDKSTGAIPKSCIKGNFIRVKLQTHENKTHIFMFTKNDVDFILCSFKWNYNRVICYKDWFETRMLFITDSL